MNLVLIRTYDNPIEANLAKGALEDEGVECFLHGENMNSLYPVYNIALGGTRLMIHKNDFEKALELLNQLEANPYSDSNDIDILCPNCGSNQLLGNIKVNKGIKGFFLALISILFASYPLHSNSMYACKKCGKKFEAES